MTRLLQLTAFLLGLGAVGWVGAGYVGTHWLALAVTLLVGAFYLMGALELRRFQQATGTLQRAVAALPQAPTELGAWLAQLHPSLRNAVRQRIEGERVALPGPALAPYLAGLLVLLGMLGTFLGMVVTLNGTGSALESATDLGAIRATLAAPVRGLGLAFGTSLAGVATSAMLGLLSALCRRDRLLAAQALDAQIAGSLRVFSLAHQREESFKLLQQQGRVLPELVDRLQAMMATMERQSLALHERLASGQDRFHGQAEAAYAGLAASVERSLKESLTESARLAGATIQPVVEATMATVAGTFERRSAALVQGVSECLDRSVDTVSAHWREALAQQALVNGELAQDTQRALTAASASFAQQASALVRSTDASHAQLQAQLADGDRERLAAWTASLENMAGTLQDAWQQAGARSERQQQDICATLTQTARDISVQAEAQARGTLEEVGRLLQAASEAPRAAAAVISELREKLSDSMARDNAMLEERGRILETLETLLSAVNHASTEQRGAIDALVSASAEVLERAGARFGDSVDAQAEALATLLERTGTRFGDTVDAQSEALATMLERSGTRFGDTVEAQSATLAEVSAQMTGSAVEVASLGEAFGLAVQLFSQSNDKLTAHLQRIEGALGKAIARSDEQLDYYVAQAREVIDLSIMSQKRIVEDLQQLAGNGALAGSDA